MNRRDFILSTGSVATVGVSAGCLGGDTSGGENSNTSGETAEHVNQAADYLDEAGQILEEDSNDSSDSFNANRITRRTDAARDEIELARDDASNDERDRINDLESLADAIDELALIIESAEELLDNIDSIDALIAAGRFDDAAEDIENTSGDIDDIQDRTQSFSEIYEEIDAEAYDEIDDLSQDDIRDWATEMEELLDALNLLFNAFGHMVDGLSTFEDGVEEMEAENWGAASVRFDDAADQFDGGVSIVRDAEDEAPSSFRSEFIEIGCLVESLRDASEEYADAMEYASNDQWGDAEDALISGDRALENCY